MLHRVEVQGFKKGPVKRHGCPSHGIGLTPDEKEIWVADGAQQHVHVFDATVMPPKQIASIKLREQPGWVTFSLDGRYAYPSTGEVIDTKTKKIVAALTDEKGRAGAAARRWSRSCSRAASRANGRSVRYWTPALSNVHIHPHPARFCRLVPSRQNSWPAGCQQEEGMRMRRLVIGGCLAASAGVGSVMFAPLLEARLPSETRARLGADCAGRGRRSRRGRFRPSSCSRGLVCRCRPMPTAAIQVPTLGADVD